MKKQHITFLLLLLFVCSTATAQFKKPLTSPRDQIQSSEAKWNVGILGGGNITTWLHFNSLESSNWYVENYKYFDTITNSLGYFGGIAVERMLKSNLSIGLNVVYAQHNVKLGYLDDHFPYKWDIVGDSVLYGKIQKSFSARYSTVEAYVPFTYYIGLASTKNIKPYFYFAPRFSYILPLTQNKMKYSATYYDAFGNTPIVDTLTDNFGHFILDDNNNIKIDTLFTTSNNTVPFNRSTYRKFNIGATLGVGSLFKINAGNYYFLVKFDVSANLNGLPTYKDGEIKNDEFKYLRYSTDAQATLTLMLPLKKQLQGACMKWGEYD